MPAEPRAPLRFEFVAPLELDVEESDRPNALEALRDALGDDRRWSSRVASVRTDPDAPIPHVVVWIRPTANDPFDEIRDDVMSIARALLPAARLLSVERRDF
jgi:hypothetical protein